MAVARPDGDVAREDVLRGQRVDTRGRRRRLDGVGAGGQREGCAEESEGTPHTSAPGEGTPEAWRQSRQVQGCPKPPSVCRTWAWSRRAAKRGPVEARRKWDTGTPRPVAKRPGAARR